MSIDQIYASLLDEYAYLRDCHVTADDIRPLSRNQQSMWFLQKMDPETTIYNAGFAVYMETILEPTHMQKALQLILDRHEVLRAVFPAVEGMPVQIVLPRQAISFELVDASSWLNVDIERAIDSYYNKSFDLVADNMLRARVYVIGEAHLVLQVVIHHIVIDAWSIWLLVDELRANLVSLRSNISPDLKPLRYQYTDFVQWQEDMLAGERGKTMASFWQEELDGELPILDLPVRKIRALDEEISYDHIQFSIEQDLVRKIRELAFSEGASTYSLLLAVFQILLSKYSGQRDVLVGTPVHGRGAARFATIIGYFVNLAAMRGDVDPDVSFRDFLRQSGEKVRTILHNQHYPFSLVVNQNRPISASKTQDIVQVIFNLVKPARKLRQLADVWIGDSGSDGFDMDGMKINHLDVESGYGLHGVDLYLEVVDFKGKLAAKLGYNVGLFEPDTIARMAVHFCHLLEITIANPDWQIRELPILSRAERELLLYSWNDTEFHLPPDRFVQTLFAEQVERNPEAVAIIFRERTVTYKELDERSNQLAYYLHDRGVGPDSLVGIFLERSVDMVVALLGTLKAGGAYLPLDPDCPNERLSYMLQDAQPLLVITQTDIAEKLSHLQDDQRSKTLDDLAIVDLDEEWPRIENEPTENVRYSHSQEDLAYVIYTSGSIEQPKGVAMPHRALTNLIQGRLDHSQVAAGERTLQYASLSFDISFQEIFTTWCSGGTLVLVEKAVQRDAARLLEYIEENQVNRLYLPFVALQYLAEAANIDHIYPTSVCEIITTGEQLKIDQAIIRFFQAMPQCCLANHYGPTETHVVTTYELDGPVLDWPRFPPIGRPIENTQVYILDRYFQPVPVGVTGELYIGGACLARGYLNDPQLTSKRFIDNPFAGDMIESHAGRLYKTGDLARYLPDGNIEFLGRLDRQIKIRGYRVEPGETEVVLAEHPDIQQTVVVAYEDETNKEELVAYYIQDGNRIIPVDDLRQYLQQKLPDYMIPAVFIPLKDMPLTPSGKIDRNHLPEPERVCQNLILPYARPRSPQEKMLADIWASVLKVERIGIHDNFFDLGGHSLLATQVLSRMDKETGIGLPLRTIFDRPTIAGLSATLNQANRSAVHPPPMITVSRDSEIPLSFAQERMWFLHQLAPSNHAYHIPISLKYQQAINREALQKACDDLVVRQESLRTIFPATDGVPRQEIIQPFPVSIIEIDLSSISANEQESAVVKLIQGDIKKPFDLASIPPWRFTLFQLNDESFVFYFAFHHIIFDLWSTTVLWQEFHDLYQAHLAGEKPVLPALNHQYADFSVWQRSWMQGPVLDDMLSYWTGQLAGLPLLDMPTDHQRPPVQTFDGATIFRNLTPKLTKELRDFSRKEQVSPFMLLLAAFKVLLARYSGQTDIAIGVPVANRHYLAVEPIIGTFVNTVVVRSDLSGDPTFAGLLQRVRDVLLDAYANQDLPFEQLVNDLAVARDISHSPLFQILFDMTNAPFDHNNAAESPISFMKVDRGAAQFDISVNVVMEEYLPLEPQLVAEYNSNLFDQATIQRLLAHYETLLSAVVIDARLPISRYEILTPAERYRLIEEWNQTQMACPSLCLHELFEKQARRTPEKNALSFNGKSLTYQELDERSNQLARHLQNLGVGPETVVAVLVEHSLEMVIGLLGILKAGGAYLPLDPGYPDSRLAFMIEDAQSDVILTQSTLLKDTVETCITLPVYLDRDWPIIEQLSSDSLPQTTIPENLAYIIYTSGSTGKPKGVQVEHRNVVNFMIAMKRQPGISADDILLSVTNLSFDISILEIFLPLLNGAQLVIIDRLTGADGRELSKVIQRSEATILQATPTTWSMLIDAGWQNTPNLQKALCGGEVLSRELADAILERNVELWNMYGPTETTIWSSVQRIKLDGRRISIGGPIGNTSFYILDHSGTPVPTGVIGELCIGGDGVARGYLNRTELTEERFPLDSFTSWSSTGRLYRTGDLVKHSADGFVEYIGRSDFQVKLQGHRIELGEVESALSAHPQVAEAVVTLHTSQYDQLLVAYVVSRDDEGWPTNTALREFLRDRIPKIMIPSMFVRLEKFPLTPNRKIDRNALPDPENFRPDLEIKFVAPRNELETVLAAILADLLGLEAIGIHDDFFELGGHSLQATRYVARVSRALRTELMLWSFLKSPNVADLAKFMIDLPEGARIVRIAQLRVKLAEMSPEEVQNQLRPESHSGVDAT